MNTNSFHDYNYERWGRFYIPISIKYYDILCWVFKEYLFFNENDIFREMNVLLNNKDYDNTFQSPLDTNLGKVLYK